MAYENVTAVAKIEIERAIRRAVAEGLTGAGGILKAFVAGMDIGAKGDMAKVNRLVAAETQVAVEAAYASNVEAVRATPAYSRYDRRSGYLGRVIARRDFVTSDYTGIRLGNRGSLDKEAAHWRRLNFGAGADAGPGVPDVPLRLFGETIGTLSLPYGPSPAFSLPKGFFVGPGGKMRIPNSNFRGGGGSAAFYPNRKSPYEPRVTDGIRGRHFLEEGLEEMAYQIEARYADLLNEWVQRGSRKAKAVANALG